MCVVHNVHLRLMLSIALRAGPPHMLPGAAECQVDLWNNHAIEAEDPAPGSVEFDRDQLVMAISHDCLHPSHVFIHQERQIVKVNNPAQLRLLRMAYC